VSQKNQSHSVDNSVHNSRCWKKSVKLKMIIYWKQYV